MNLDNHFIYDIETFPDIFTCAVEHATTNQRWFFEISNTRNDYNTFIKFIYDLKSINAVMVGFNNIGFDYPVVHMIVTQQVNDCHTIYLKAQAVIDSNRFDEHMVWLSDRLVYQLDLYKVHHFDNKRTSLKILEFNMRSKNIEDLPFTPGENVGVSNYPELRNYNVHDTSETKKFLLLSVKDLEMRSNLSQKYHFDFMNHNDGKIGKDYFINTLGKENCYYRDYNNERQPRQSIRSSIDLNTVIFPYITFETPAYNNILDYFKSQTITETKGVFSDVKLDYKKACTADPKSMKATGLNPANLKHLISPDDDKQTIKEKKQIISAVNAPRPVKVELLLKHCPEIVTNQLNYTAKNLNCMVSGFQYGFGAGGIHGCVDPQTVVGGSTHMIIDIDVASYYPNLAIANKLYPEHLGVSFCDVYADVYEQRTKTVKKSPENKMLKNALVCVYGNSNQIHSPFYDPKYTMSITINGQLLLCVLAEQLQKNTTVEMIQINTDGLTIKVPRTLEQWVNSVCDDWEKFTLLALERVEYTRLFLRDVNNFIGEFKDGSLKRKGDYAHNRDDPQELPWHKDHGCLIVPKAAQAALVDGIDPDYFIRQHNDFMDFMKRTKVPRSSRLVGMKKNKKAPFLDLEEVPLSNVTRYYITEHGQGVELVKLMPPLPKDKQRCYMVCVTSGEMYTIQSEKEYDTAIKNGLILAQGEHKPIDPPWRRIGIDVGFDVAPCNNLNDVKAPINYQYYIDEAKKLIDVLQV